MLIVEFPLETVEQAKEFAEKILKQDLAVVSRIYTDIHQQWVEDGKIGSGDIVIVRLRAENDKLEALRMFVKENHPWEAFCFDVIESKGNLVEVK